jgi:archaellin
MSTATPIIEPITRPVDCPISLFSSSQASQKTTQKYTSFKAIGTAAFEATLSSGVGIAGWNFNVSSGQSVRIRFYLNLRSGSPAISLRAEAITSANTLASAVTTYTTGGWKDTTILATGNAQSIAFSEGSIPADFTIQSFTAEIV